MELESVQQVNSDRVKIWLASPEFTHLVDTCVLAHANLEAPRRLLSRKVAARCVAIARRLDLDEEQIVQLELAARVHRVGELYLHDSLRKKSFLDLSSVEMKAYRQYPVFSAFRLSDDARQICDVILKHREYSSGDGFLQNDADAKVPFSARILCAATEYEELIMYRGITPEIQDTIQRRMLKNAIGRYDPQVIEALMYSIVEENILH